MVKRISVPALLVLLLVGCYFQSSAQLVINEFMASNSGAFVDPDYNQSADWIEIYNTGATSVQLNGYYLTDNLQNKTKWQITTDLTIQAGQFVVFWADTINAGLHTNFKLSASGEEIGLVSPSKVMIDSIIFGQQDPNISMGRQSDGSSQWAFFTESTPGSTNNTVNYNGIVKNEPSFSLQGGVFTSTIFLTMKTLYGGEVRYTLDGSEPNEQSQVAIAPIYITSNTVVRARIYKQGQVPGPVVTNSYFFDPNNEFTGLPIVSVCSDPDNFWDQVKGIYVVHDSKPEWEIPINIELFEKDGRDKAAFNLPAGAKSTGLYSWQLPQKMLGISFRKEYGASKLEYPLIFDKARKVYDTFSLRASGSDWGNTMMRDEMIQSAAVENTNIDDAGYRDCVVFINGEYMGIHNIREKVDEDYVVGNHGFEPGSFDLVEEIDAGHFAEAGDLLENTQFVELYQNDLSIQPNFDAVAAVMDIDDFTDMVCTEVYSGNSSIGHNLMKYKLKGSGKWKWILMDFDRGFEGVNDNLINFYVNNVSRNDWPLKDLMNNANYKKQFGLKLADLLFTNFNPARMIARIDAHAKTLEAEIPKHAQRWEGTHGTGNYSNIYGISSLDYWLEEVEVLKTFAEERPPVILNDLTNYGFQSPLDVTVTTSPAKAGRLTFNGLKIPVDECSGGYPEGEVIKLTADANAGYKFMGWKGNSDSIFIGKEQVWKYSDTGTDLGTSWQNTDFSDASWKTGQAELGYGEDDERTVISFGPSSSNKYITSYFRKGFVLNNKDQVTEMTLLLKCDDGAVVYLNGHELIRYNMPTGTISFNTTASTNISGSDESNFHAYTLNNTYLINGNNVIAVEVHQNSASSSDASFDLELSAQMTGTGGYLSTNREYVVTLQSALNVCAVFENDGKCILPAEITTSLTLDKACSPYVASSDVHITSTGKLTILPGVEVWMSDGASIYSSGIINARGTQAEPVIFKGNPESTHKEWGFISIADVNDTSYFKNVIIEDASRGQLPREVAAITAYRSVVKFDSIHFEHISANPIASRFSDLTVLNSSFHSNIIGDMVNVTRGKGHIENCEFIGNYLPDNDAIDFNGGANSTVKNCIIRDFFGLNNDAIDLGERATNITLDGMYVHDITDKGVSIGQWSKVNIRNSLFTNCNLGAGVKDSSFAAINHCTFYSVGTPVASYEKIVGRAGGNVTVTNSILSNSYDSTFLCDEYSKLDISYSSSDNNKLPDGKHNIFGNPHFENPTYFDFSLLAGSSCIGSANDGINMGSGLTDTGIEPEVLISAVAYFTLTGAEDLEFIGIYNPGSSRVDISRYTFRKGITFTFPEPLTIGPGETFYVTSNSSSSFWNGRGVVVFQWESGRLADEGEQIQLTNEIGTMIDEVHYNNKAPWPVPTKSSEAISLMRYDVDNHFGEYWQLLSIDDVVDKKELALRNSFSAYPNPANGTVTFTGLEGNNQVVDIYTLQGCKVKSLNIAQRQNTFDLSGLTNGVYLLRSGLKQGKLIISK